MEEHGLYNSELTLQQPTIQYVKYMPNSNPPPLPPAASHLAQYCRFCEFTTFIIFAQKFVFTKFYTPFLYNLLITTVRSVHPLPLEPRFQLCTSEYNFPFKETLPTFLFPYFSTPLLHPFIFSSPRFLLHLASNFPFR
jgi:hypothetical protein